MSFHYYKELRLFHHSVNEEDFLFTSSFTFNELSRMDCVDVNLLDDFSVEGDHRFTVQLTVSDEPTISTSGFTEIIIQDTDGMND